MLPANLIGKLVERLEVSSFCIYDAFRVEGAGKFLSGLEQKSPAVAKQAFPTLLQCPAGGRASPVPTVGVAFVRSTHVPNERFRMQCGRI